MPLDETNLKFFLNTTHSQSVEFDFDEKYGYQILFSSRCNTTTRTDDYTFGVGLNQLATFIVGLKYLMKKTSLQDLRKSLNDDKIDLKSYPLQDAYEEKFYRDLIEDPYEPPDLHSQPIPTTDDDEREPPASTARERRLTRPETPSANEKSVEKDKKIAVVKRRGEFASSNPDTKGKRTMSMPPPSSAAARPQTPSRVRRRRILSSDSNSPDQDEDANYGGDMGIMDLSQSQQI